MFRPLLARVASIVTLLTVLATLANGVEASAAVAKTHHKRSHATRCVTRNRHHHRRVRRCRTTRHSVRRHARARASAAKAGPRRNGAGASSTTNPFGQRMFGVAAGGTLQSEAPATLAGDLNADQAVGSKWLRIDINWAQIQAGGPSSYDWSSIDAVVQGAESRGMSVLGVILYTPSWDRPSGTAATYGPSPASYATFASAAVAHYAALGVHAYELWNEENSVNFWTPAPSPAAYAGLLKSAYPAIKAADPSATVVTGGLSPDATDGTNYLPTDFLSGVYANGGQGSFDAVGAHPYCFPAMPGDAQGWSAWYQMYGTSVSLRSVMVANGDSAKKIWATEFGAPTNGPSGANYVSQSTQALMIAKAYKAWSSYSWAGPLFTYQGRDLGTSTTTVENFFGFINNNGTPKPGYSAYRQAVTSY